MLRSEGDSLLGYSGLGYSMLGYSGLPSIQVRMVTGRGLSIAVARRSTIQRSVFRRFGD
jgi:hypothetical protein